MKNSNNLSSKSLKDDFYSIQRKITNKNKIPDSLLTDAYIYSLYDITQNSEGDPENLNVSGIIDILKPLTGQSQIVTFQTTRVGVVKGKWGDTGIQKTISAALKQISSSIQIPNIDSYSFAWIFKTGGFIITKEPLEKYIDEKTNIVIPKSNNSFFIQESGEMNIGMDGTGYFKLQSMNSYQWSINKKNTGETIWKIIELTFGILKGEMVDEIVITFTAAFRSSRKMISMLNDKGLKIEFDIDFKNSFFEKFESGIEHINTLVGSTGDLTIISHTMSALKVSDILLNDNNGYQGEAPNLKMNKIFMGSGALPPYTYGVNGEYALWYHDHNLEKKQLDTEWFPNQDYYEIVGGYPWLGGLQWHMLAEYWETAIYEIVPNDKISEVSFLHSGSTGWTYFLATQKPEFNFQNANVDLKSWLTSDWKVQWADIPKKGTSRASITIVKPKTPWEDNRKKFAETMINSFINGDLIMYKGMNIETLPDVLENNPKPEYQNLTSENQKHINWFVLSSVDPKAYYMLKKDYYEQISPTSKKKEFIFGNQSGGGGLQKATKDWPLSISFQNLNIPLKDLFVEDGIERKITIKLREPQAFPKTFELRAIGGGEDFLIEQFYKGKIALDKDGNKVPIIYKQLNWYKNRNVLLTRTSFVTI